MNDLVSPDALDGLIGGIEEEARDDDPGFHVAFLDKTGETVDPEEETQFATEEELEKWEATLHEEAVIVVIRYEEE